MSGGPSLGNISLSGGNSSILSYMNEKKRNKMMKIKESYIASIVISRYFYVFFLLYQLVFSLL